MKTIDTYTIIKQKAEFEKKKISNPKECADFIRQFYGDDIEVYESFFILLLDRGMNTIGYAKISQGGITGTYVDRKIVLKYVLDSFASGVVIAHNHPSGQLKPSSNDITITNDLKHLIGLVESELLDHIILTKEEFYSFKEEDKL